MPEDKQLTCIDQSLSVEIARPKGDDGKTNTVITLTIRQTLVYAEPIAAAPPTQDGKLPASAAMVTA